MKLSTDEFEFARKMIDAEINWPGHHDEGEPEPTEDDLAKGFEALQALEVEYTERVGLRRVEEISTAIGEAHADFAWGNTVGRADIRKRLERMIETWGE